MLIIQKNGDVIGVWESLNIKKNEYIDKVVISCYDVHKDRLCPAIEAGIRQCICGGRVMDIKKYEVLLAVVDKGSFIKAASELGYTQSGITYMMNSLEKECGFPLLQRSNKGVILTLEGERLLPEIRQLVQLNKRLEQDFSEVKGQIAGKVRIGCFPTIVCAVMPRIMRIFRDKYPQIQLDLVEENSVGVLEEWLESGFIDVAFFSRQPRYEYDWFPVKEDRYVVVMSKESPLTAYDVIKPNQLEGQPFFMYRRSDGIDADVASYFKKNKADLMPTFTSSSDYAVLYMIEENLGIGMIPELLTLYSEEKFPTITTRPLDPPAQREIGLAVNHYDTAVPAVQRFVQTVQKSVSNGTLII